VIVLSESAYWLATFARPSAGLTAPRPVTATGRWTTNSWMWEDGRQRNEPALQLGYDSGMSCRPIASIGLTRTIMSSRRTTSSPRHEAAYRADGRYRNRCWRSWHRVEVEDSDRRTEVTLTQVVKRPPGSEAVLSFDPPIGHFRGDLPAVFPQAPWHSVTMTRGKDGVMPRPRIAEDDLLMADMLEKCTRQQRITYMSTTYIMCSESLALSQGRLSSAAATVILIPVTVGDFRVPALNIGTTVDLDQCAGGMSGCTTG
jgi:hypothetical protein